MENEMGLNKMETPAAAGMKMVLDCLNLRTVARLAGVSYNIVHIGITHKEYNGKPYYYNEQVIGKLQPVLDELSERLMRTKVSFDALSEDESPCAYGEDIIAQLNELRGYVKMKYIFEDRMGRNKRWRDNRMTRGSSRMSGRFTADEVVEVNMIIRQVALCIGGMKLVLDSVE